MEQTKIPEWICAKPEGVLVLFYVQPNASRSEIKGVHGQGQSARIKVKVAAPPVDGKANEALIAFLKHKTGLPISRIQIVRGEKARAKDVFFQGASLAETLTWLKL